MDFLRHFSLMIVCIMMAVNAVNAQTGDSCKCTSMPKTKACWLYCLKYASQRQLTEKIGLDSTTAKNIVGLKNRNSYSSLTGLQKALPGAAADRLSILIEKSSIGTFIYRQDNKNNGDVVNGPVTTNNYYSDNQKEIEQKITGLSEKMDQKEIRERFSARDFRQAEEPIKTIANDFGSYREFILSQIFARNLSPTESANYGTVLLAQIEHMGNASVYEHLLMNIGKLPEGNRNDLLELLSKAMKMEYGDSVLNGIIKKCMDSADDLEIKRKLKSLQNSMHGYTVSRTHLVSFLDVTLSDIENTRLSGVRDLSFNDSVFLIGVEFLYNFSEKSLDFEYNFEGVLNELKYKLSTVAMKFNNNGFVIVNFLLSGKTPYRTYIVNINSFRSGGYIGKKPADLFVPLEHACDSIGNFCLFKVKKYIPDRVFKKVSDGGDDSEVFSEIFVALGEKNVRRGVELLNSYVDRRKKLNYELIYRVVENMVNNSDSFPDLTLQILDKTLAKENVFFEVDTWKGSLLRVKGLVYLYLKYGCSEEKKFLEEGKKAMLQSLDFDPEQAESYINLCYICCVENNPAEAIEYAKKALYFAAGVEEINASKTMQILIESNKENLKRFNKIFCRSSSRL